MLFSWEDFFGALGSIVAVIPDTLLMVAVMMAGGVLLGFGLNALRWAPGRLPAALVDAYVAYMRGVPLLINLFLAATVFPKLVSWAAALVGVRIVPAQVPPVIIGVLALTLFEAALQSENIRGILRSVDRGQLDAAHSVGLTTWQGWRRIVLPQLIAVAAPILINSTIKSIKAMSLVFAISVVDIFATARLSAALRGRYLESYAAASIVYWILCGVLTALSAWLERRFSYLEPRERASRRSSDSAHKPAPINQLPPTKGTQDEQHRVRTDPEHALRRTA
jgi:ABC-type amino acid transport system permease subunit